MGNTSQKFGFAVWIRDHPHMRGEYKTSKTLPQKELGSPPHAWGIPNKSLKGTAKAGITPTCVGNTDTR
ncbi:hypothetical protein FD47_GL002875 [Lentilactobacillus parafarraginis DSM 18390 = JCM 14109]|uniref:Uncharacterized protein n=1 Tax=Lentilactobacillus parafarraginis DSM 18390 = JCM 14109 TaxID=1423786 RepID=A0A0R1YK59_9LACO|nr:hypothetical protein FD47_GL002875 [Lentilactobacillus parafarraginis DSM 18390 = JCM 14109]